MQGYFLILATNLVNELESYYKVSFLLPSYHLSIGLDPTLLVSYYQILFFLMSQQTRQLLTANSASQYQVIFLESLITPSSPYYPLKLHLMLAGWFFLLGVGVGEIEYKVKAQHHLGLGLAELGNFPIREMFHQFSMLWCTVKVLQH